MTDDAPLLLYGVKLLLHSSIEGCPEHAGHFELSTRLVRAASEEEAHAIGVELGRAAEQDYENNEGETVRWHFDKVLGVHDIMDDLDTQGAEIYSEMRCVSEYFQ